MRKLLLMFLICCNYEASADCNFIFVNKTYHPVTLQGYFLENGAASTANAWITVKPTLSATQIRTGESCNKGYKHSGQLITRVDLKNNSGYWIANKGLLFAEDSSYSHQNIHALDDSGNKVTLSNGVKVTDNAFKVYICNDDIAADECH